MSNRDNSMSKEEIMRALSLEEAALNEFKKRKSSITSYGNDQKLSQETT